MRLIPALVALLSALPALAGSPRFVDYVYIEANEGGSSGGHAALRLGDETYHFQHEHPGLLRLHRDDWQHFRDGYGVLENRTMHVSRVAVSDATYEELRRRFNERYLIERRLFEHREALHDDRVLLELLLERRRGDPTGTTRLRGAGFFFPEEAGTTECDAIVALRRRVREMYGADAIRQRMDALRRELARLPLPAPGAPDTEIPADGYPRFGYPFSRRYRDLATALAALDVLDRALPLRPAARWPSTSADLRLGSEERRAVARFADRLTGELTRLLESDRPDWGFAFLIGMARLAALRESEATGRLVLLDAFPPEPEVVPRSYVRRHPDAMTSLVGEARDAFARARARLRARDEIDEEDVAAVEAAGNRLLELRAAAAGDHDLRVSASPLVPSRDAPWSDLVVPDVTEDDLARSLAQVSSTERRFVDRLEQRCSYNLVTRNCVSELFHTADADSVELGGRIDTAWSLDFIPFVSARTVDDTWRVAQRTTLRSYRRAQLDEMYRRENPLRVWLRECNVLTSTIYPRNADDSFFLLFTDDVVAPRPLFGTVNLAAGLGAAAVGIPLLPFDGGHTLMAGLRGAVFSLPELAFVNLRKGSFDHVPREIYGASSAGDLAPRPPDSDVEQEAEARRR